MDTNEAIISGRVVALPQYSHSIKNKTFVRFYLSVLRPSGTEDTIPIISPKFEYEPSLCEIDNYIEVVGQYRSYTDTDRHKHVFVFAKEISPTDVSYYNYVKLTGRICKIPCYRKFSSGKEITGLCVANNQKHNRSYYLPVIAWDKHAIKTSRYVVGDMIECQGRIQSRCYCKDGNVFQIYELNVHNIDKILL